MNINLIDKYLSDFFFIKYGGNRVYVDNAKNRKLGRVGQPYGKSKKTVVKPKLVNCKKFKKTKEPICDKQKGCKWVPGKGCLDVVQDVAEDTDKHSVSKVDCKKFKKTKEPICDKQKGCKWIVGKGNGCKPVSALSSFTASIDPFSLPLSIQIHEFALCTHYLISGKDFFFYVQPRHYMRIVLEKIYGPVAVDQRYLKEDLDNIKAVCGDLPVIWRDGIKIQFSDILKRYNNKVPELYMSDRVGNSFKNKYGFQLLHKSEYSNKIFSFYQTVRDYFCKIDRRRINDYVTALKNEYEDKLGDKTWANYNSMNWRFNHENSDVLEFLREMINKAESNDDIRRLSEHYVNIFSDEIGDVRNCRVFDSKDIKKRDMEGNYILVKLKNPEGEFIYDNTEMVVHRCDFDGIIPAQYHLGIMRNPSDLILKKFTKILSSDKLSIILELNKINRFF